MGFAMMDLYPNMYSINGFICFYNNVLMLELFFPMLRILSWFTIINGIGFLGVVVHGYTVALVTKQGWPVRWPVRFPPLEDPLDPRNP
jgi:hypothetical protein